MQSLATKIAATALVVLVAVGDGGQVPRSDESENRMTETHATV